MRRRARGRSMTGIVYDGCVSRSASKTRPTTRADDDVVGAAGSQQASDAESATHPAGGQTPEISKAATQVAHEIERLREHRARPGRNLSIAAMIEATRKRSERARRQLGQLIELWHSFVPAEIADRTTLTALRGGVLHVTVDSSAVAYELDRLLREGLLAQLRSAYRGTLTRVKACVCELH